MSHVDEGTLHALVDNALPDDERAVVEAHLATCGECAKHFADATAMARQVHTLLGALDDAPVPLRVEKAVAAHKAFEAPTPVRAAALASINLSPMQRRMRTLRRVALAASVLVVAGVSYRVGVTRTMAKGASTSVAVPPAAPAARPLAPSVVVAAPEAIAAPSAPTTRVVPPSGPRATDAEMSAALSAPVTPAPSPAPQVAAAPPVQAEVPKVVAAAENAVTGRATAEAQQSRPDAGVAMRRAAPAPQVAQTQDVSAPRQEVRGLSQVVVTGVPSASQAAVQSAPSATMSGGAIAAKMAPATIAGYQIVDEVPTPAATRRRYIASEGGVMLTLLIAPAGPDASKPTTKRSELTVTSGKDGSVVRWHRDGLAYELQGPLSPDSLVKLATQLK